MASPAQDYMLYCMGCHGAQAQGVPGKVPPLAGSLARFMRTPEGRNYVLRVPGAANSALSDAQLTAVLNWLAGQYGAAGNEPPAAFTAAEVAACRHVPLANVRATRREVVRQLAATGRRRRRITDERRRKRPRSLLTEYRCDADSTRPEREIPLQPADARHQGIDRRVVVRQGLGIGQIVDEGRERPWAELRTPTHADEGRARQHEIR